LKKILLSFIVGFLFLMPHGHARAAVYQDYGSMPLVQMMLTMMDLMGMLNRVPAYGGYGGVPGYSPLYSATAPFAGPGMTPYGSGLSPYGSGLGYPGGFGNPWQSMGNYSGPSNYTLPGPKPEQDESWGMGAQTLTNPWEPLPTATRSNFGMNGIWQGLGGDLIAIYGNRFLWTDQYQRSLSGQMEIRGEYLWMRISGNKAVYVFRIQQTGDGGFTAASRGGHVMRFRRLY